MYIPYQTRGDELKVVNGRESAEQYMMMPNSRCILMDATQDRFYLKTSDAAGISTIKTYDFTEVQDTPVNSYITREEVEELIKNELNSINKPTTTTTTQF